MLSLFAREHLGACRSRRTAPPLPPASSSGGTADPHAATLAAYAAEERATHVVCGVGCSARHLAWNAALVVGGAIVAVGLPQAR